MRNPQNGQYTKSNKGKWIVLVLILIAITWMVIPSKHVVKSDTATTTVQSKYDSDIEKQGELYMQGKTLEKQKVELDAKYKTDSEALEKKLEDNRKEQLGFTQPPSSKSH